MASYGLDERFKTPKDCFRLLDPAAYDIRTSGDVKPNKYPFLSNTPRKTFIGKKLYTETINSADIKPRIPNITSLKSRTPRFPYESFSIDDFKEILCRCGYESPCECETAEDYKEPVICQATVRKCLYKGPPPRSSRDDGLSCPSKKDRGFDIGSDGTTRRVLVVVKEECPPFYDARVHPLTDQYHGWKWSKWTSSRCQKTLEVRPGPAHYTIVRKPTPAQLCDESLRAERRRTSKQPRYVEQIQEKLLRDVCPGPADHYVRMPRGTDLRHLGPKADRFPTSLYDIRPNPATYFIKRDLDLPNPPTRPYRSKMPTPACFGIKAPRFKYRVHKGPGPADYDANVRLCNFGKCSTGPPFGISAVRFKDDPIYYSDDDDEIGESEEVKVCPHHTWQFRSRSTRFPPPRDVFDTSAPKLKDLRKGRSARKQYLAPFYSSERRFEPWKDWMPVYGATETPGPGYYNLARLRCLPAVNRGPLFRATRFQESRFQTPAPNEYTVGGGIETVLATHNKRLKENKNNKDKFHWEPPKSLFEERVYSPEQRELKLFDKAIRQLEIPDNPDDMVERKPDPSQVAGADGTSKHVDDTKKISESPETKQKILRTFLYNHPQQVYF